MTLREHVRTHTDTLLDRVAKEVRQAAGSDDEDAVHDLRVSIRRLRECLRTFEDLYPAAQLKGIRRELKGLTKATERVRSADIAMDLLKKAGLGDTTRQMRKVRDQRTADQATLNGTLRSLAGRSFRQIWRKGLGL